MLLEKFELSPESMLKDVKTLTQRAPTSVSWRCTRCVVVCEKSEVTSVEEEHDEACETSCGEAREEIDESLNRSSTCHAKSNEDREGSQKNTAGSEYTGDADCLETGSSSEPSNKL